MIVDMGWDEFNEFWKTGENFMKMVRFYVEMEDYYDVIMVGSFPVVLRSRVDKFSELTDGVNLLVGCIPCTSFNLDEGVEIEY